MKDFGVLVPIVTPCSRTGEVDLDGLKAVCTYVLESGCKGIFVAGSTGRGPWFDLKTKNKICKTVKRHIGEHVPLFAGCMASGLSEMLENTQSMADAGAQVAVLTAPGYFNYSHKEIESIFLQFADTSPLPVIIYDIPVFAGIKLDVQMVSRLSKRENVIGFKDSSADMERFKTLLKLLENEHDFYLFQGKENLIADSLIAGASGVVASLIHIDPIPFVELYRSVRKKHYDLAHSIQGKITELINLMNSCFARKPEVSTLFQFINAALRHRGICKNILLEHEGECLDWIKDEALKAIEICSEARSLIKNGEKI